MSTDDATPAPAASHAVLRLTALTVLLGLQCFRVVLPTFAFLLRDRFGWDPAHLGLLALGIFALGFSVSWVIRVLGLRRALVGSVGLLIVARLGLQLWQGDPVGDLVFACLGLAAFVLAAPIVWVAARSLPDRESSADALASGWVLGLLLELFFHVGYGTWDLAWREGLAAGLVALGLAAVTAFYLWALSRDIPGKAEWPEMVSLWSWFGVWPLFFLYAAFLGFPSRIMTIDSVHSHEGLLPLAVALALGAFPWWYKLSEGGRLGLQSGAALILFFVATGLMGSDDGGGIRYFFGLASVGILTSFLLRQASGGEVSRRQAGPSSRRLAIVHGGSMLLLFVLTFGTTSAWQVSMPFSASWLPVVAALVAGACAFSTDIRPTLGIARPSLFRGASLWTMLIMASIVMGSLPTHFPGQVPTKPKSRDWPLRVVTYNVHCGISPLGRLDPESIAETLRAESPDVVILQEVSRGWLLNGGIDLADYLAHRLGMNFVFHGTADATWGNAVLTSLPIVNVERHALPPKSLLLHRGYLDVELAVGDDDRLRLLATHLHHPREGGEERLVQSRKMVEAWDSTTRTLMAGDLNALPGEPEIELLRSAGLHDALDQAGDGDSFTYPSWDPVRRIDYVWLSPDLRATEAWVSPSTASDHAAVAAVVGPVE